MTKGGQHYRTIDNRRRPAVHDKLRKAGQARPVESVSLYRLVMDESFDGVCICAADNLKILDANHRFFEMTGYSREELGRITLTDIGLTTTGRPEDIRQTSGVEKPAAAAPAFCRSKDGAMIYAETKTSAITFGGSPAILVTLRDVTDCRRNEAELERRATIMHNQAELLEVAEDAIMVRDLDERIVFWNKGAEDRYGWSRAEALGKIAQELLQTRLERPLPDLKAELFAKGSLTEELTHFTRSGNPIVVESRWVLRRDPRGEVIAIVEINNDITQRKQAEKVLQTAKEELEASVAARTVELQVANERLSLELERRNRIQEMLRKAAERYKNLIENSPMGIYRTNADGLILMANPSLLRMLGRTSLSGPAASRSGRGLFEPTYLRKRFLNRLRRDGRVRGYECSWKRRDGSTIFVRENAKVVRSSDGSVMFCEGTVEDISEQKKAEDNIQLYQRELRSLAAELSLTEERERRRIATVLHDHIGQVLAMSKIRLGSLAEFSVSGGDEGIADEIRQYLDQAIAYTRSLTIELSPPVLYTFGLEAALEWLTEQIVEQGVIACEFEDDHALKRVGEEVRVFAFTAVRELLANVVKHAHASKAKVTVRRLSNNLVIHVADDGVGFNTSKLKTLDNRGFGLFSIRERLRHLGGEMEVKSAKGRGTRVSLEAPLELEST
jgi:PAS domain S-box-containing protein